MNETEKPFACPIKGCDMTFTNEDHLNLHQKKHDMMLNLGLTIKNNDIADQTPTPTRFIRNCEEVGLFQDLQNVNPFDDIFKKAVESVKSGNLPVLEPAADDSLHTPHILPIINDCKYHDSGSGPSSGFTIGSSSNKEQNMSVPSIVIEVDDSDKINVKDKIKQVLLKNLKKDQTGKENTESKQCVNEFDARNKQNNNSTQKSSNSDETKEKIREMNRAAQFRCRKRKQVRMKKMEHEMACLRYENKRLCNENNSLKFEIVKLKEMLLKSEGKLITSTSSEKTSQDANPVLFRLISPSNDSLCVPVLPKCSPNMPLPLHALIPVTDERTSVVLLQDPKTNSKFRKIVPKT